MSDALLADDLTLTDRRVVSSAHARMLVLELSVAALIAQLPQPALEEVAGVLCFVANSTEEAEDLIPGCDDTSLGHVRHWAGQMLQRVMSSRKASRGGEVELTSSYAVPLTR